MIQPISYAIMRLAIVVLIAAIWSGIFYLWWRRLAVRITALIISVLLIVFAISPDRSVNVEALRAEYIHALHTYTGTAYVWGGENRLGIDCSGLVREGLIQANLQQGITTLNPTLMRQGLAMWWFDLSALALRDGVACALRLRGTLRMARRWCAVLTRFHRLSARRKLC